MLNYKITLVYQSAPQTFTSKSRYVLATTPKEAIIQARSLMSLPLGATVARVEIH